MGGGANFDDGNARPHPRAPHEAVRRPAGPNKKKKAPPGGSKKEKRFQARVRIKGGVFAGKELWLDYEWISKFRRKA